MNTNTVTSANIHTMKRQIANIAAGPSMCFDFVWYEDLHRAFSHFAFESEDVESIVFDYVKSCFSYVAYKD